MLNTKECKAEAKKRGVVLRDDYDYFSLKEIEPKLRKRKRRYDWEDAFETPLMSCSTGNSYFCCAIEELGEFHLDKALDKHWDLLIQLWVAKSNRKFFLCGLPEQEKWKPINDAFEKVGFTKAAQENSKSGKYKVNVWQYIKK